MTVPANGAYVRFYAEIHGGNDADTSLTTAYFDTAVLSTSASLWSQAFTYDSFGNITKNATVGISFTPGYSTAKNQFTSLSGVTPTYDGRGDLTYDGTHNYGWNLHGKMISIDSTTVTYDAFGRMVEKNVGGAYTQIVYGPLGTKFAVMSGQTLVQGFIPLPTGAKAVYTPSGLAYYRHHDHLGSSRLATTPSRTMYSSTAYAPFGEPYSKAGTTDLSFTGQDQDTVSGIHDFLDRNYIPVQGRWFAPDPAGLAAVDLTSSQTWNRYAYVSNNPLAMIDPFGDDGCYDMGGNVISCPQGVAPGTIIDPSGTTITVTATPDPTPTCPPGGCADQPSQGTDPGSFTPGTGPGNTGGGAANNGNVSCNSTTGICVPSTMMKPRPAGCGAAIAQGAISLGLDVVGAIPAFGNVVSATAAGARAVNGIVAYGGAAYGIATGLPDESPVGAAGAGAGLGLTLADTALEGGKVIPVLGNFLSAGIGLYDGYQLAKTVARCW